MRSPAILASAAMAVILASCATKPDGGDEIVLTGSKASTEVGERDQARQESASPVTVVTNDQVAPAPPPLPPPPVMTAPAVPAMNAQASRGFKLGGSMSRPAYIPPVIVPADPGYERYDGKEVSPV